MATRDDSPGAERNWETLSGGEWAVLLAYNPEFAEHCDWEKLDGGNWEYLLIARPEFAEHCDWTKLDGGNWRALLGNHPEFAEHYDWEKLEANWERYLPDPEFAEHCDWEKLDSRDLNELFLKYPKMRKFIPPHRAKEILGWAWHYRRGQKLLEKSFLAAFPEKKRKDI